MPESALDTLEASSRRVQAFVAEELAKGAKYSANELAEQCGRYDLPRARAREVISGLTASRGLVVKPLPEGERSKQRKEYLEAVFKAEDLSDH